eukprot:Rmarinus@m.5433
MAQKGTSRLTSEIEEMQKRLDMIQKARQTEDEKRQTLKKTSKGSYWRSGAKPVRDDVSGVTKMKSTTKLGKENSGPRVRESMSVKGSQGDPTSGLAITASTSIRETVEITGTMEVTGVGERRRGSSSSDRARSRSRPTSGNRAAGGSGRHVPPERVTIDARKFTSPGDSHHTHSHTHGSLAAPDGHNHGGAVGHGTMYTTNTFIDVGGPRSSPRTSVTKVSSGVDTMDDSTLESAVVIPSVGKFTNTGSSFSHQKFANVSSVQHEQPVPSGKSLLMMGGNDLTLSESWVPSAGTGGMSFGDLNGIAVSQPRKEVSLLDGHFSEEESKASFQDALLQWRKANNGVDSPSVAGSATAVIKTTPEKTSGGVVIERPARSTPPTQPTGGSLLCGTFNEDESKQSFQEALKQWRGVELEKPSRAKTPRIESSTQAAATINTEGPGGGRREWNPKWKLPSEVQKARPASARKTEGSESYFDKLANASTNGSVLPEGMRDRNKKVESKEKICEDETGMDAWEDDQPPLSPVRFSTT